MLTKRQTDLIDYIVMCIGGFAERFGIGGQDAHAFLSRYGGIGFLIQHYDAEHTLGLDDAIDDLERVCASNGGRMG